MLYFRPLWGEVCVKIDLSEIESAPLRFNEEVVLDPDDTITVGDEDPTMISGIT